MSERITKQIRIITNGKFHKLMELIREKFEEKHGIKLYDKDICETMEKAMVDANIKW